MDGIGEVFVSGDFARAQEHPRPIDLFCARRGEMLAAWRAVIAEGRPQQDLRDEIAGTCEAMRHLQMLGR